VEGKTILEGEIIAKEEIYTELGDLYLMIILVSTFKCHYINCTMDLY
jgi:hypothetical protein